jgi:predicted nucleotidyltransferase
MNRKTLVKHYAGSKSYGTNIASSDTDFRGIFLGDRKEITTPFFPVTEWEDTTEEDTKLFELNFFISLACENNPNIIETLYVDKSDIILNTPEYEYLRTNRDMFLTKKIAHTTSSYAIQSLSKMKNHNKFINTEELNFPLQTDFLRVLRNFTDNKEFNKKIDIVKDFSKGYKLIVYSKDLLGLLKSNNPKQTPFNADFFLNRLKAEDNSQPLLLLKFNSEEYDQAKIKYTAYSKWKEARIGSVRNLLEDKFGYDTKDAMHLVRLMRIGYECITEGTYNVRRSDAKELLEIRSGDWSYDKIYNYAKEFDNKIKEAVKICSLPENVDKEKAANIILDIQNSGWYQTPLPKIRNQSKLKP